MVLRYSTKSSTQHPLLSHKGKEYTCVCLCIHTYNYIYIIESLCFILESNTALYINYESESEGEVAQSCLTLRDPMDCSLPGSSVRGIFQARVLEWVAISFSRRSSRPWNRTWVSHIVDTDALPSEPPGKSRGQLSTIFPLKKKKTFLTKGRKGPRVRGAVCFWRLRRCSHPQAGPSPWSPLLETEAETHFQALGSITSPSYTWGQMHVYIFI